MAWSVVHASSGEAGICSRCESAWVGAINAAATWLLSLLPPQAADEILADPRAVVNGSLFPPLTAERVQGGYRV